MSFLRRLFGRRDEESQADLPITLNVPERKAQLARLEQACDELMNAMHDDPEMMDKPGWRERIAEYRFIAGEATTLRQAEMTRESLLDLAFEVRPVFTGAIPPGLERIGPLQEEVLAAAKDLGELLPGERSER